MSSIELQVNSSSDDESGLSKPGVYVKTFGCQMNEYDSEKMLLVLSDKYRPVTSPEEAEVVIVNTCSVREKGEHKLFSLLGSLKLLKDQKPNLILGVGGCVAQQEGQQIIKRSPSVDFVVGTHNLSLIPSLVSQAKDGKRHQLAIDYREEWEQLPDEFQTVPAEINSYSSALATPVRALVAIQRGCDKNCAYCVVPTTRGVQVSRSLPEILKEIRLKARLGAKEVLLLGQTVNSYGMDLSPRVKFEDLIREVHDIAGIERIRFTSPHPAEVRPSFMQLYGSLPKLCPHIHLPLQSGSDRILKLMNRNYRRARYLDIVSSLRERLPGIALTTDIIVGFPTETEEEFQETMAVLEEVRYHSAYSFKYSIRPHTEAQGQFSSAEEIEEAVKHRRLLELQARQDEIGHEINSRLLGQTTEVLVEGQSKGIEFAYRGRTPENSPIEVVDTRAIALGRIVKVRVVRASPHGLRGEVVDEERIPGQGREVLEPRKELVNGAAI